MVDTDYYTKPVFINCTIKEPTDNKGFIDCCKFSNTLIYFIKLKAVTKFAELTHKSVTPIPLKHGKKLLARSVSDNDYNIITRIHF